MRRAQSEDDRTAAGHRVALLTPIAKAFSTDIGCKVSSLGVQIHGGMGFVEETGAAQYYRDARILPIYEGTNGIQAMDLVFRKLPLEGGAVMKTYLTDIAAQVADVQGLNREDLGNTGENFARAVEMLTEASQWMGQALMNDRPSALASATPYLELFGLTIGAHYLTKCAVQSDFTPRSVALARFYCESLLPQTQGLGASIMGGAGSITNDIVTTVLDQNP